MYLRFIQAFVVAVVSLPVFSYAESTLGELAIKRLELTVLAAQSNLEEFKAMTKIRVGNTDVGTPTPIQIKKLLVSLRKLPNPRKFIEVSSSLQSKYFDLRDHSVERTLVTLRVPSVDKYFYVLCTETFNCLNERDAHRRCVTLAD